MSEEFFPMLTVQSGGTSLAFRWAGFTGLAIHGYVDSKQPARSPGSIEGVDRVHFVREGSVLHDPELRKLFNESNTTFIASRNIPRSANLRKRILELSREHRSSIRQCIENMQFRMRKTNSDVYENWVGVLDNIDHIWHLCELLHLDVVPGDIVLSKLLEWTRLHTSNFDLNVSEVIAHSHMRGAELRYPKYWEMVVGVLLEGRFEACRALLRLHSEAESTAFTEAELLLRSMPLYSVYSGISVTEFTARWRGWKSTVRAKLECGLFSSRPRLMEVMRLLGSDEPSYELLRPYCVTWYQMMTASLLLTDQTAKIHDLTYHAGQCITHFGGTPHLKLLDNTILDILDSNIGSVVRKLQLTSDGGWCAVHLTNLFSLTGRLNAVTSGVNLEEMLLEYGQLLTTSHSHWQSGLTYLEHCGGSGREAIRLALEGLPLTSEEVALRVVAAARDHALEDVVKSVCKIMQHQKIENDNLAGALSWSLLSNDATMSEHIADRFLRSYARGCSELELGCSAVLAHLGQTALLSPRLTFLSKYCEFHTLYESGSVREAAELLVRLLESKVSPKYFWLALLSDALPLLEERRPGVGLFSHDDTTILLACLEELSTDVADNIVEAVPHFASRTRALRIAITKNLASTVLKESTAPAPYVSIKCD